MFWWKSLCPLLAEIPSCLASYIKSGWHISDSSCFTGHHDELSRLHGHLLPLSHCLANPGGTRDQGFFLKTAKTFDKLNRLNLLLTFVWGWWVAHMELHTFRMANVPTTHIYVRFPFIQNMPLTSNKWTCLSFFDWTTDLILSFILWPASLMSGHWNCCLTFAVKDRTFCMANTQTTYMCIDIQNVWSLIITSTSYIYFTRIKS